MTECSILREVAFAPCLSRFLEAREKCGAQRTRGRVQQPVLSLEGPLVPWSGHGPRVGRMWRLFLGEPRGASEGVESMDGVAMAMIREG